MHSDELRQAIRALVSQFQTVGSDDDLLGLDSLSTVLLVEELEDRFNVRIRPHEVTPEHFASLASLTSFMEPKLA